MKKLLLLFFAIFISVPTFAQDPNIVGTWYLQGFTVDLGDTQFISKNSAPQNPSITIDENFNFIGIGACNTFSGIFNYITGSDDSYLHENFTVTTNDCENSNYNNFEEQYFSYFDDSITESLRIIGGGTELYMETFPGFGMVFQNTPFLGIKENELNNFKIYPNPVRDVLTIASDNLLIENYKIYSTNGTLILSKINSQNNIDVSGLANGIYFIEVTSESGNKVQKFIKE